MKAIKWWHRRRQQASLQQRFIRAVLTPPFVVLFIIGIVVLLQLDNYVRNQAANELERAASTTAAKLEREFSLRETILKRTGEEMFKVKQIYVTERTTLDNNRASCSEYVKQKKTFQGSQGGICDPFLSSFANQGAGSLAAIEDGYVAAGEQLTISQNKQINDHLSAYKQFFPETLALLVVDDKQQVISSALTGDFKGSAAQLYSNVNEAAKTAVYGKIITLGDVRLAVFAYPITGGSVLAAYDVSSDSFIKDTWQSTPINRGRALAVILDSTGQTVYPGDAFSNEFKAQNEALRQEDYVELSLSRVKQIAVAAEAKDSNWAVAVASPKTVVFGPVRDAQIAAVLIIGGLLVGFLWMGAYFIRKTVVNIMRLVVGAVVFANGDLKYQISLDNADEEFVKLAETMNNMAARIAKAEKEIDEKNKEFISIATHELRTPLTAIIGNLSMVYEDMPEQLNDQVKPLIEQAFLGTSRLRGLVNDMLDVARLEGGRVEFVLKPQDIKKMISDAVETLRVTANEKPVSLRYDSEGAVIVTADASKLAIIINNFISNAIKYNRPNGGVIVSHSTKDGMLVTAIADTGLGIPDDQKAHMFEKFFRVKHDDRKDVIGTGLGMYITKQYIEAQGGQLWFESTHGQGTTFYFSLPIAAPQVDVITPITTNQ